jgi:PTH1 family peptidyl-tRNA hydrolase
VLKDFSAAERKELPFHIDRTADAVESLLAEGLDATQQQYNG